MIDAAPIELTVVPHPDDGSLCMGCRALLVSQAARSIFQRSQHGG
jgi:LmbE family N-acetylglucosaminyl deacetylase